MIDESVFIVDIGSSSAKLGYSGEDVPSYVLPSVTSKGHKNLESIEGLSGDGHIQVDAQYTNNINVHPIRRGVIKDWDQLETVWQNITEITNLTQIDSTSIFIVESPRMNGVDRSKWAELLFETYRASSICLSNSCALTLFASGRTTGVAVECGAGITTSMPVFEGLSLRHAGVFTDYGGQDISFMLKHMLAERGIFIDLMSAKTIKEQLAYANGFQSSRHTPLEQSTTYFLPDGTDVSIDAPTLGACTEKLFNSKENSSLGLVNQVRESITLCDESVKKDLIENIIISGGTSMLPGLGDRLQHDLTSKFERDHDVRNQVISSNLRIVPNSNYREKGYSSQRKHAAWIGASLLSSFDTYHKTIKITRQEWEESPDTILSAKCI